MHAAQSQVVKWSRGLLLLPKFQFEFPEIFCGEWNSIFWNFRKRDKEGNFGTICPRLESSRIFVECQGRCQRVYIEISNYVFNVAESIFRAKGFILNKHTRNLFASVWFINNTQWSELRNILSTAELTPLTAKFSNKIFP